MALRKITVDNSVRYIPKSEQTKEKGITPNTRKIINKTKTFQKTKKK